jgi:hypothetical protein
VGVSDVETMGDDEMTRVTVSSERMREICLECVRNAENSYRSSYKKEKAERIAEWRNRLCNRILDKLFGAKSDYYVMRETCSERPMPWRSPIIGHANDILSALEDTSKPSVEIDARDLSLLKSWCKS